MAKLFLDNTSKYAGRKAMRQKVDGVYKEWTFAEYRRDVIRVAKALNALGVKTHDVVLIQGFNAPEWFLSAYGTMVGGAIMAGVYTTNEADICQYLAQLSKSPIVIVEDNIQLKKWLSVKKDLPLLEHFVVWGEEPSDSSAMSWNTFLSKGDGVADSLIESNAAAVRPGHCCALIFTSGTTGMPKAVALSHDNVSWTIRVVCDCAMGGCPGTDEEPWEVVSYLPLSHIAGELMDLFGPIHIGGTVTFARPDALKGTLVETLAEVQPHTFVGVPRVYEKMEERMKAVGASRGAVSRYLSETAKAVGYRTTENARLGKRAPWNRFLPKMLFGGAVHPRLGFRRAEVLVTGAAPIQKSTLDYFDSLLLPINEIYGLSETTGLASMTTPRAREPGAVGFVPDGVTVKLANPSSEGEGEICVKGRNVMMGYMFNQKATEESFDEEGFFHTGDLGRFVTSKALIREQAAMKSGMGQPGAGAHLPRFLKITGRIKEIIITAGGENIPPVNIEDKIKEECPALSNVVVIGDQRKFLSCLVTPKVDMDDGFPTDRLVGPAKGLVEGVTSAKAAAENAKWKAEIEAAIKRANKRADSNAQRVQKFHLIPTDFTNVGESPELGPTMKLMRRVVYQKYAAEIESMYSE